MRFSLLFKLVAKDLWQDRKVSFFIVSALMAVIAPLLLFVQFKIWHCVEAATRSAQRPTKS